MGEVGRQPLAVACGMIFSEAVRRCRRHGVVNERHQRQGFNDGEVYADLLRGAKLLQHEYIGVGQQEIKALDQQDRQRDREPAAKIVDLRPGRDDRAKPAIEYDQLADHGGPDRRYAGQHGDGGAEMESQDEGAGGEADDQRLPHDELGHQPSRIQSWERAMPSWVLGTTKAGSVRQPI